MRRLYWSAILLFPACTPEPTFEERFEETESRIERKVDELDRELAQTPVGERASGDGRGSDAERRNSR